MIIYTSLDILRIETHESTDSEILFQIANEEYASINFELNSWIPFDAGDYVMLFGNRYTLMDKPAPIAITGSNRYAYTLKFESPRAFLDGVNFELFDDTSLLVINVYDPKTIYCKGSVVQDSTSKVWLYKNEFPSLGVAIIEGDSWTQIPIWSAGSYVAGNYVYMSNVVYLCLNNTSISPVESADWTVVNTAPAFDFTTVLNPSDYAALICSNMNRARPNQHWVIGNCISANPLMQAFSNVTCLGALTTICNLFQSQSNVATEHWIDLDSNGNFRLNINSLAVSTTPIINLEQGNGLVSISKQEVSGTKRVTRLVALGSTSNLYSTYRNGSNRLMLPDRYYIDAPNIDPNNPLEGVMTWDNIMPDIEHATEDYNPLTAYPAGSQVLDIDGKSWDCIADCKGIDTTNNAYWKLSEGTVTTVITEDVTNIFIDANLTFNPLDPQCLMVDGTQPKVSFITGNMAGYQFPITNSDTVEGGGYQLTIAQIQDSVGSYLPTSVYGFNQYDQYVLIDLYMPNDRVISAEQRLKAQAEMYLAQYCIDQNQYDCPVDEVWATNNLVSFQIGQLVHVTNTAFGINDDYRIITLNKNITSPYKQTITLSQLPYIPSSYQDLKNTTIQNSTVLQQSGVASASFKSRTFRSAQEALDMAFDPDGVFYTKTIQPLSVMTSAILIGTRTQQFSVSGLKFSTIIGTPNYIEWTAGSISDSVMTGTLMTWSVVEGNFIPIDDTTSYYCFIKCPQNTALTSGEIIFTQTQYKTKGDDGFYYFLVGTLGTVYNNTRDFNTSYGFSFIDGNNITTGMVKSHDGSTYFDLDGNEIGGKINFKDGLISGNISIKDESGAIKGVIDGSSNALYRLLFGDQDPDLANFSVDKDGIMKAVGAVISGMITSLSGKIGNFNIFDSSLISGSIEFSDEPVESLASLLSPSTTTISRQDSWTGVDTARTQNMVLTSPSSIIFNVDLSESVSVLNCRIKDSSGISVATFGISEDIIINLPSGTYYLEVDAIGATITISGKRTNLNNIVGVGYTKKTKIGDDGLFSFQDATHYFYFSQSYGCEIRTGTMGGIKMDEGINKYWGGASWVAYPFFANLPPISTMPDQSTAGRAVFFNTTDGKLYRDN